LQSAATPGTLIRNALNAGFKETDIEEREVDRAGYDAARAEDPVVAAEAERIAVGELIQAKIREQAIAALIAEGKITADGKTVKGKS